MFVGLQTIAGAERLAGLHASELPQKDELCGAFCALLTLRAFGLAAPGLEQDAVALTAGTLLTDGGDADALPTGEPGRRDYRASLPTIADAARAGTAAAGVALAIVEHSGGALEAVALTGPWCVDAVVDLLELAADSAEPVVPIANIATVQLWGGRPSAAAVSAHLEHGRADGPPPDWDVGHFVLLAGVLRGPKGALVAVLDTYRSIGWEGVHLQPVERMTVALERPGRSPGGILVAARPAEAAAVRALAARWGIREALWDNGTAR